MIVKNIQLKDMIERVVIDEDKRIDIIENMEKYGGSFVKGLAQCIKSADNTNLKKIKDTFPEYIKQYASDNWRQKIKKMNKGGKKI